MNPILNHPLFQNLISIAFAEDIGSGDVTSLSTIPSDHSGNALIIAKEKGIIAGVEVACYIFERLDPSVHIHIHKSDGEQVNPGDSILTLSGNTIALLTAERTALNFMQRMSGVATQTARYAHILQGLHTHIIDTRKTTPGMRILDKWAVRIGGGMNHRMGLYDMVLIKDNHVDFAGGIGKAIAVARQYLIRNQLDVPIEIETRTLSEVQQAIDAGGIQRIMFDNFDIPLLRQAVALVNKRFETEASGGITEENLRAYAETGVDFISSGALTHSVKCFDLSMRATN